VWNPVIRDTLITFNAVEKTPKDVALDITAKAEQGLGFFVCETQGRVLGFATYAQFRGGVGYAKTMEHTIILSPALNGMGVGRRIMQTLCDHAKDRGVKSMFAGVSARNDAGVQFHRAVGFQPVAGLEKVGFKFGQFIDLVLMQKFL